MTVPDTRIKTVSHTHDASFKNRFPMLSNLEMEFRWGGRLCLSRNNVPAFGEVAPGLFSACCQNGLGTAKGTLHGMLAADLASEQHSDLLTYIMSQAKPQMLPPSAISWLGATAIMKWGEFKAGAEL
jgi:glycine/D-amino acid oxidase-like deaminating enzyme